MANNNRVPVVILYNYYKTWTEQERLEGEKYTREMIHALEAEGHTVRTAEFWQEVGPAIQKFDPNEWIVFQWCEGVEGEVGGDARICDDLDRMGYTYTGNPGASLRLSVQKGKVKKMLDRWHIPTPPGKQFDRPEDVTAWDHFPSIVKPVSQHCSFAVNRDAVVHNLEQLRRRIAFVNETAHEGGLAEKFIAGREINVGIWGNGRPRVLPLREIDFSAIENPLHQMVTWDSKWVPDSPEWNAMPVITEVNASAELRAKIEDIAIRTYRAFGCRDYARVDFRIDENEQPWVVDVNPNPDITSEGGFAGGCKMAGYSYGQAISNIVQMAVARRNRRNALMQTLAQKKQAVAVASR